MCGDLISGYKGTGQVERYSPRPAFVSEVSKGYENRRTGVAPFG